MKKLTVQEHDDYIHPCGKTGKQLDDCDHKDCDGCVTKMDCMNSHAIIGEDAEPREKLQQLYEFKPYETSLKNMDTAMLKNVQRELRRMLRMLEQELRERGL